MIAFHTSRRLLTWHWFFLPSEPPTRGHIQDYGQYTFKLQQRSFCLGGREERAPDHRLRHEAHVNIQGNLDEESDKAFVPNGTISCIDARSKPSRKEQHKRAYFNDLKGRSRYFNCGKKGEHWTSDWLEPPK